MPTIWNLHVPLRNKISLSLVFGLGSLICILSIIRLRALSLEASDPTMASLQDSNSIRSINLLILYTALESSLGVICACVVIIKPLFANSKFLQSLTRRSNCALSPQNASMESKARRSAALKRMNASWELAAQRSRFQDMQISKIYEIQHDRSSDLEAAETHQEEQGAAIDVRAVRQRTGSTVSNDAEMEIRSPLA
ncbi:MAG: hypothetical protein Q9170_000753 [Blastenia crenularia]